MPRKGVDRKAARQIRQRLRQFVKEVHGGDWGSFQSKVGVQRTTAANWKAKSESAVPEVAHLLMFGERGRLSLNWLLLGVGPMLLDDSEQHLAKPGQLRALLVAAFAATDCSDAAEADRCLPPAGVIWTHLVESLSPFVRAARAVRLDDAREMRRVTNQLILEYERGNPAVKKLVLMVARKQGISERRLNRILRTPE